MHDKVYLVTQEIGDDSAKADSDLENSSNANQVCPHTAVTGSYAADVQVYSSLLFAADRSLEAVSSFDRRQITLHGHIPD